MGRPPAELQVGARFGDLVILGRSEERSSVGQLLWNYECQVCKGVGSKTVSDLNRGRISCLTGCRLKQEMLVPVKAVYGNMRRGAVERGHEWGLSFEEVQSMISQDCHYCGARPSNYWFKEGARQSLFYNGIDRVDNSVGYLPENCVTACKFCNLAKSRFPVQEFLDWLSFVKGESEQKVGTAEWRGEVETYVVE